MQQAKKFSRQVSENTKNAWHGICNQERIRSISDAIHGVGDQGEVNCPIEENIER
jgi:hypothetical protein